MPTLLHTVTRYQKAKQISSEHPCAQGHAKPNQNVVSQQFSRLTDNYVLVICLEES